MTSLSQGLHYLLQGLAVAGRQPWLFVQVAFLFSLPALLAAGLVGLTSPGEGWRPPVLFVLQSITTVVAPVVFMMAIGAVHAGERVSVWRATRRALPWLPRYLWTNVHTSAVFWVPVGTLLLLQALAGALLPGGVPEPALLGWSVAIAITAIFLHSRTVLAPFLAVHGNLPGTVAAWESWRLSQRHLGTVMFTLLVSSLPASVLITLLAVPLMTGLVPWPGDPEVLPQFTGVALQLVRLTLVPAFYILYRDLSNGTALDLAEMPGTLRLVMGVASWRP